jgi:hypothetical protein
MDMGSSTLMRLRFIMVSLYVDPKRKPIPPILLLSDQDKHQFFFLLCIHIPSLLILSFQQSHVRFRV